MTTTSDHQTDPQITSTTEAPRGHITAGQLVVALAELDPDTPILSIVTNGVDVHFVHLSKLWMNEHSGEAALQFGGTALDYGGPITDANFHDDLYTPFGVGEEIAAAQPEPEWVDNIWDRMMSILSPSERAEAVALIEKSQTLRDALTGVDA